MAIRFSPSLQGHFSRTESRQRKPSLGCGAGSRRRRTATPVLEVRHRRGLGMNVPSEGRRAFSPEGFPGRTDESREARGLFPKKPVDGRGIPSSLEGRRSGPRRSSLCRCPRSLWPYAATATAGSGHTRESSSFLSLNSPWIALRVSSLSTRSQQVAASILAPSRTQRWASGLFPALR